MTDEEYLAIFLNGFPTAGFNRFYGGREEMKGKKSSVDYQEEFDTEHGVALSLDAVPVEEALKVMPKFQEENVYTFRKTANLPQSF